MTSLNIEYFFLKIYDLFTKSDVSSTSGFFSKLNSVVVVIFSIISIIFLVVIIYSIIRIRERNKANHHKYHEAVKSVSILKEEKDNKRWQTILDFITSDSPSDWRVAVIECDNMLDDLTKELGLVGENLGERLKNAPVSHFKTLENAWEAHRVRNKIAHEGMSYEMEYREAKKAIENYEAVFNEFNYL